MYKVMLIKLKPSIG